MREAIRETRVITCRAMCDCGGEFKRDVPKDKSPFDRPEHKYTYICDKCGKVETSTRKYPYTQVEGN